MTCRVTIERREPDDPWGGRQPRYERLVRIAPMRYGLVTKLPSGERVTVELGRPGRVDHT